MEFLPRLEDIFNNGLALEYVDASLCGLLATPSGAGCDYGECSSLSSLLGVWNAEVGSPSYHSSGYSSFESPGSHSMLDTPSPTWSSPYRLHSSPDALPLVPLGYGMAVYSPPLEQHELCISPADLMLPSAAGHPTLMEPSLCDALPEGNGMTGAPSLNTLGLDLASDAPNDIPAPAPFSASTPSPVSATQQSRPSRARKVRSPRKHTHRPASHLASSSSSSTSSPPAKTPRPRAKRRNQQAEIRLEQVEAAVQSKTFKCPAPRCGFVPSTKNRHDLERHVKTHREDEPWVCCGVPVGVARKYGIEDGRPTYEFQGVQMTGGCQQSTSRLDSLQRHLKDNAVCRTDVEFLRKLVRSR